MDFSIKKGRDGRGGLVMHLLPGRYHGAASFDDAITVREGPFWFLEHAIRVKCSRDVCFSHWGHTPISREEWATVLPEWQALKLRLQSDALPVELGVLRFVPINARKEFLRDFSRNSRKLALLIDQLTLWVTQELQTSDEISLLGI